MLAFLSDEWLRALDDALRRGLAGGPNPARVTFEQVVTGVPGPDGPVEVRYRIVVSDGGAHLTRVGDAAADVSCRTDYATAVAIARGECNAQTALAAGRLRVGGDPKKLAAAAAVLANVDDAAAALRGSTTFPPP